MSALARTRVNVISSVYSDIYEWYKTENTWIDLKILLKTFILIETIYIRFFLNIFSTIYVDLFIYLYDRVVM